MEKLKNHVILTPNLNLCPKFRKYKKKYSKILGFLGTPVETPVETPVIRFWQALSCKNMQFLLERLKLVLSS